MKDVLLIADGRNSDQHYTSGLNLHSPFITLTRGSRVYVAAGGFEYPQAKATYKDALRIEDLGKNYDEILKAFCKKYKCSAPLVPRSVSAGAWELIKKACPKARLVARGEEAFPQRAIKRAGEIKSIKEATRATESAILAVKEELSRATIRNSKAFIAGKPLTSEHLKRVAAATLAQHNCSCPDMIISSGKQSALPHHEGSGQIAEGSVIVDIFPKSSETLYYSDMTRTFIVGRAPKTFDERYAAVLAVHKEARKKIKHGMKNVEAIVKPLFEKRGFMTDIKKGTGYIHSLGHGVGLDIHEEPRLNSVLKSGHVITIEPGLYYDYGVRVEDIGLVTKSGFSCFSKISKEPHL